MTTSGDSAHRVEDEGLRAVLAELTYPAPVWLLVAQAHSWGADVGSVEKLNELPIKDYQRLDEVLSALGQPPEPAEAAPSSPKPISPKPSSPKPISPKPISPGPPSQTRKNTPALSKAIQHKTVGEGLAVGLLALDVEAVTINRHLVESAFALAWHGWTGESRFSQIHAAHEHNDIVAILRSSSRRKGLKFAAWFTEGEYVPRLCVGSSLEDAGLAVGRRAGVTHRQWLELARRFVARLNQDAGEIRYRR